MSGFSRQMEVGTITCPRYHVPLSKAFVRWFVSFRAVDVLEVDPLCITGNPYGSSVPCVSAVALCLPWPDLSERNAFSACRWSTASTLSLIAQINERALLFLSVV
jgi:hypothetical protein